ncbi:cysteine hydrolase [Chimaeribacter californicus]|uniref:Cysteine hydrolase n=1 Tax=Chimaeribacter californicus TaxID=2060067 RepID=A0A2N5EBK4_9GAMM|nr:cysteine hydrolase family protein [Chimaeribacter californicus]PLR39526.1 cysteine hydrolase [Chimaeribacter californicus]
MSESSVRQALLVIDMQNGLFFADPPPFGRDALLENINTLIDHFHQTGQPVVFIRHTGPAGSPIAEGTALWSLVADLHIDEQQDKMINKHRTGCFEETPLAAWLQAQDVGEVVITGLKTQYCIDTACRTAAGQGFRVVLAADAHSCMDTADLTASQIIRHHNTTLHGAFARVMDHQTVCNV